MRWRQLVGFDTLKAQQLGKDKKNSKKNKLDRGYIEDTSDHAASMRTRVRTPVRM